jgi:PTS system fructose-specific IIC component/PTS system nitrogen regulatory IIA component
MKLSERMIARGVFIDSDKEGKVNLMTQLVDLAADAFELDSAAREQVLEAVIAREEQRSTGIGCGLAVPHCKVDCVDQMYIVAMTSRRGVDFDSSDKDLVYLFFLIISPENTAGPHLTALSSVARLVADAKVRRELIEATTPDHFLTILKKAEERYV